MKVFNLNKIRLYFIKKRRKKYKSLTKKGIKCPKIRLKIIM